MSELVAAPRRAAKAVRQQLALVRNELVAGGHDPADPETWEYERIEKGLARALATLEGMDG